MRASPAFQISIQRYGAWRGAVALTCGVAAAALVAWLFSPDQHAPALLRVAALAAGAVLIGAAAWLLNCQPMSLRWDTQTWHLGPATTRGEEPWSGRLAVALDLGSWLLLRFRAEASADRRSRTLWLPVQRRGHEARWHALRCAVYCARPVDPLAAGLNAAPSPESQE